MDRQNHLISLAAVFLSLGIGILIGASMGVNALVLNQISVIEQLQDDIQYFKDETKLYVEEVSRLNLAINSWQALEEDYFNPCFIKDKLAGYTVKVFCQGSFPGKLREFLEIAGCHYQVFLFRENIDWEDVLPSGNTAGEDPAFFMTDLILEKPGMTDLEETLPVSIREKNILTLYENDPSFFPGEGEESADEKLLFAVGVLDPFLAGAIENHSFEHRRFFPISADSLQNGQYGIDSLPARIKLLESIQEIDIYPDK